MILGAAALVVLGAALAAPWPLEARAGALSGVFAVLLYLARRRR